MRKVCEANHAGSFEKAAVLLRSLAGLDISAKQVQLLTEHVGGLLCQERDKATVVFLAPGRRPSPPKTPIPLLVITADGGRVQTRQPSPDEKWKEDKLGVVYDALPSPERPGQDYEGPSPRTRSLVATMESWDKLGDHLSALADRRGYAHARQVMFVSDGATSIRSQRERGFPNAAFVLDWGHATEHIHQDAIAGFGTTPAAEHWYEAQKDRLWKGHLDRFFQELAALSKALGPPPKKPAAGDPRRILATDLDYFTTNRAGLDYPTFRKRGWPLGSGIVESTIKQVGKRVKGTEKHWSMAGVEETLQVVSHLIGNDGAWDAFWKRSPLTSMA